MAYYAKIVDAKVINVITAEESFFDTFVDETAGTWIETKMDGSIRKNYAGIGFSYDSTRDAFIPPQPYPSWTLNEDTCLWNPPIPYPTDDNKYNWDEDQQQWTIIND
jgi:hypothetical protein